MLKKLSVCLFFLALTLHLGTSALAASHETLKINLAHGGDAVDLGFAASKKFADEIKEKSGGAIEVHIYTTDARLSDQQILESTQSGALQMSAVSTMAMSEFEPSMQIFNLPYLFPNYFVAYKVLDGEIGKSVARKLIKKGVRNLTYWEGDYRQLSNSLRPIVNVDDVAGLKIQLPETPILISWMEVLNAIPARHARAELYTSLEQRFVDGQDNGILTTHAEKYYQVQPYYTLTNHIYTPVAVLINDSFFSQLSDANQGIIQTAAENARDYQRSVSKELRVERLIEMKQAGLKVTELSPQETGRFRLSVQPVYNKFKSVIDQKLLQQILDMR